MIREGLARYRGAVVLVVACYWVALFIGTHVPLDLDEDLPRGSDKLAHFAAYAGLAFQLGLLLAVTGPLKLRQYALVAAVTGVYGVLDELLQIPVGRTADVHDLLADWAGIGLGLAVLFILHRAVAQHAAR